MAEETQKWEYSPPGKFFPPFLQMSLRGRSSRSNPRLQWETASFLAVTSHLDYWKKLFWTAISRAYRRRVLVWGESRRVGTTSQ
jgi:hypothetical protein